MESVCPGTQKQVDPIKNILFWFEKHVLDLLEPIMKAPAFVREELRLILWKMIQVGSEIPKIKVQTFWVLEI